MQMKKLLIIPLLFLFISLEGQIIRANAFARAQGSTRTYTDVLTDGNTKGWYMIGDGSATYLSLSGTDVTNWQDQSGSNNDLTNGTSAEQPDYDSGNAEIDINADAGTDDNLQKTSVAVNQPYTAYAVLRQNVRSNAKVMLYWNVNTFLRMTASDANIELYLGASLTDTHAAVGAYGIVTIVGNGANSVVQWNAQTATTGNAGTTAGDVIRVGAGSNSAQFSIKEYIYRAGADSESDRTLVRNYLNAKYSIY